MRSLALSICLLIVASCPAFGQGKALRPCPCELVVDGSRFLAGGVFADAKKGNRKDGNRKATTPPRHQPQFAPAPRPQCCATHERAQALKVEQVNAIIETAGTADAADAKLVSDLLVRVPDAHIAQLREQRTRVVVVRGGITEFFDDLEGEEPAGWPEGATFEDVPAVFHPDLNLIVLAVDGHETADGPMLPRRGMTLLHELGHALDPSNHGGEGSTSAVFRDVHAHEARDLPEHFQLHEAHARAEAYAEAYARNLADDHEWFVAIPELDAYWDANPLGDYFDAGSEGDTKKVTVLDTGRPTFSWAAAPKEDGPTRYKVHLKDAHGNAWVVGDSVRDAFQRRGKALIFAPSNLGLSSGQQYSWRVEAKSKAALTFSAWQHVRTAIDAEQKRNLLQGGLPLPFVAAAQDAAPLGSGATESDTGCPGAHSQGLSGLLR